MYAGTVSPVQLNLAAAVSDTATVTVALQLSGSLTSASSSSCGCAYDLKVRYVNVAVASDTVTVTVTLHFVCVSYRDHCTVSHASTVVCSAVQSSEAAPCVRMIRTFDILDRNIKYRRKEQFHIFEFPKSNNRNNKKNEQKNVAAIMATLNIGS